MLVRRFRHGADSRLGVAAFRQIYNPDGSRSRYSLPAWRLSWRGALTAILGGLMMGDGGRMAFGCNIGAFFSVVVSGSLHGCLWLVCGFTESIFGTYVRKWLGDGPYRSQ